MTCWNLVDDLKTINAGVLDHDWTADQVSNALMGLVEIYQVRFDSLFASYESVLADNRSSKKAVLDDDFVDEYIKEHKLV